MAVAESISCSEFEAIGSQHGRCAILSAAEGIVMKWQTWIVVVCLLIVGAVVGFRPGSSEAVAQPAKPNDVARFSIAAYANPNGSGAYVVDQSTGDIYMVDADREPRKLGRVGK